MALYLKILAELVFTTQLEKGNRKVSANLPNLPSGIYTYHCEFANNRNYQGVLKIN